MVQMFAVLWCQNVLSNISLIFNLQSSLFKVWSLNMDGPMK